MDQIIYLFNADFEQKLILGSYQSIESSKLNQEFEYLIHWLDPATTLYSSKMYDSVFQDYLLEKTGEKLKSKPSGKAKLFCQDFEQLDLKLKLSSKFETAKFLIREKLVDYPLRFLTHEHELAKEGIYKAPYGISGSGHYFYPRDQNKISKVLKEHGEILHEPLLERSLDFSSLFAAGELLITYENYIDDKFQYKGTSFTPNAILSGEKQIRYNVFLEKIKNYTQDYKGIMSVDGFLYNGELGMNPCCEINSRKTMGYFAYKIWNKYYPNYPFFKFLLFKNNFTTKQLEGFYNAESDGALLLTPKTNRFLIFCLAGLDGREMKEKEEKLVSTLFNNI